MKLVIFSGNLRLVELQDFFSFFEEPEAIVKIGKAGLFGVFPILRWVSLGYFYEYLRRTMEEYPAALPEWKGWREHFQRGRPVALLLLVLFSPAILSGILAFLSLSRMEAGLSHGVVEYLGRSLLGVFLFLLTCFLGGASFFLFPLVVFRFLEGEEIFWALHPVSLIKDFSEIVGEYTRNFLFVTAVFFLGETVLALIFLLFNFSLISMVFGAVFFLYASSCLFWYLAFFLVKVNAPLYRQLPYQY